MVEKAVNDYLYTIGKSWGNRIFMIEKDSQKLIPKQDREDVEFRFHELPTNLDDHWHIGIENGYIELGVPQGAGRMDLLRALVD